MKKILIATTLLMSSGFIFAAEQSSDHKSHHPDSGSTMTQNRMGMSAENMPMMQEMRSQMKEIHQTVDPDKRAELLRAHMNSMRKMMKMMHGDSKAMMGQGMNKPNGMMEKRMNMMQMMMDQMLQNQAASEETSAMQKRHDHRKSNKY